MDPLTLSLIPYSLPFIAPITTPFSILHHKEGFILKITDSLGHIGYGDASPLEGYSAENIRDVAQELSCLLEENPFSSRASSLPSVNFALNSALHMLFVQTSAFEIPINRLHHISSNLDEYAYNTCIKIKIGHLKEDEALNYILSASKKRPDITWRIDVSSMWDYEQIAWLSKHLNHEVIDYIEDPTQTVEELIKLSKETLCLLSVDHLLTSCSPEILKQVPTLASIILKPSLLGYAQTEHWIKWAKMSQIKCILSSCYESSIGIMSIGVLAQKWNLHHHPIGLDTLSSFEYDIVQYPPCIDSSNMLRFDLKNIQLRSDFKPISLPFSICH